MRTTADRVRQAVSFEVIGLLLTIPLAILIFGFSTSETSGLAVIGASLATGWNYVFNLLFDHGMQRLRGTTEKTWGLRVVHAVSFELGLMIAFLPIIAWRLDIGLIDALVMDLAFVVFYVVYAFIFTWAYDRVFPDPQTQTG